MNQTIDILICDDHQIFRDGIKATLGGEPSVHVLGEAESGKQCLELLQTLDPRVILMDINMPEMDGIECLRQVKEHYPDIKVIALTQFDEKRFVKQMLKYGADGYILKSTTKRELLRALNEVLKGRQYFSSDASDIVQGTEGEKEPNRLFPHLSDREKEIIRLLCHEKSTKQIADELSISFHTVESHRANVFRKVGVQNLAGLVRWAVNNGMD